MRSVTVEADFQSVTGQMTFELGTITVMPLSRCLDNRVEDPGREDLVSNQLVGKNLLFPTSLLTVRHVLPLATATNTKIPARWLLPGR
jgi:hypothetical protein